MRSGAYEPLPPPRAPRRRTLMLLGAGALTAATLTARSLEDPAPASTTPGTGVSDSPTATDTAADDTSSAAPLERFGFLIDQPAEGHDDRVAASMALVDSLGMGWVRFGISAHTAVHDWDAPDGTIAFQEEALRTVARTIEDAHARGLKVCLMIIEVYPVAAAPEAHFVQKMRQYWTRLGQEFGGLADTIQIFNEPDGAHYRTFAELSDPPPAAYLTELAGRLRLARETIRAVAPQARITTNIFGYPVDDAMERRWHVVLDAIAPSLDLITVDAYPQLWVADIADLPLKLARLAERYRKPVSVGELGLNTCADCATEAEQAKAYAMYVDVLRDSVAESVFFYKLRDGRPADPEQTFGVMSEDGKTLKPAWTVLTGQAQQG